jgi:hypothetical protein
MDESTRLRLIDRSTQDAKNRDARVQWRVNGHAFYMHTMVATCVGCGVPVSGYSCSATPERVVAEKASRALPPCTKPWNLEKRLREIDETYGRTGQSSEEGGKVTLESVNEKLDRIIKHFRIK